MPGRRASMRGAALLSFAIFLGMAILSIVMAFTASIATKQANTLGTRQQAYLDTIRQKVEAYYKANASVIDSSLNWPSFDSARLQKEILEVEKWGATVWISKPLAANDPVRFRRIVVFLRTDTDDRNPPDASHFVETGEFISCPDSGQPCEPRRFLVFDGQEIQKANYRITVARVESIASRAQAYFKARALQDPERNVSINYFRPPFGNCVGIAPHDIPCLEEGSWFYRPLEGTEASARVMSLLGLDPSFALNAWGMPIEVANAGPDVNWCQPTDCLPPFTFAVRTQSPYGGFIKVRAVQQL